MAEPVQLDAARELLVGMLQEAGLTFLTMRTGPELLVPLAEGRVDVQLIPVAIGDDALAALSVVVLEDVPDEPGGLVERMLNDLNGRTPIKWWYQTSGERVIAMTDRHVDGLTSAQLVAAANELVSAVEAHVDVMQLELGLGSRPMGRWQSLDPEFDPQGSKSEP